MASASVDTGAAAAGTVPVKKPRKGEKEDDDEEEPFDVEWILNGRKRVYKPLKYSADDGKTWTGAIENMADYELSHDEKEKLKFKSGYLVEENKDGNYVFQRKVLFRGIAVWGVVYDIDVVVNRKGVLVKRGRFHDLAWDYRPLPKGDRSAIEYLEDICRTVCEAEGRNCPLPDEDSE
jgi:hypothetical protein